MHLNQNKHLGVPTVLFPWTKVLSPIMYVTGKVNAEVSAAFRILSRGGSAKQPFTYFMGGTPNCTF